MKTTSILRPFKRERHVPWYVQGSNALRKSHIKTKTSDTSTNITGGEVSIVPKVSVFESRIGVGRGLDFACTSNVLCEVIGEYTYYSFGIKDGVKYVCFLFIGDYLDRRAKILQKTSSNTTITRLIETGEDVNEVRILADQHSHARFVIDSKIWLHNDRIVGNLYYVDEFTLYYRDGHLRQKQYIEFMTCDMHMWTNIEKGPEGKYWVTDSYGNCLRLARSRDRPPPTLDYNKWKDFSLRQKIIDMGFSYLKPRLYRMRPLGTRRPIFIRFSTDETNFIFYREVIPTGLSLQVVSVSNGRVLCKLDASSYSTQEVIDHWCDENLFLMQFKDGKCIINVDP